MASYQYVVETGLIVPDTGDVQTAVQLEFTAALGSDLILTANTPQGTLITAETLARDGVILNNAAVANQINPNIAGGTFLDAIWQLTGGQRGVASRSTISGVEVGGVPSVTILAGAQASVGEGGAVFKTIADVTLDGTGAGVVDFQAVDSGPVAAPVGDLNWLVSGVLGWETVSNPNPAVLGVLTESDRASRARRRNTLALQGSSLPEAILSNLYATPGVQSATFRENTTNANITIEGVVLVPHSMYACVNGGTDLDVATAILAKKSGGCNYNGAVTVDVTEPASGQVYPVKFSRPTAIPLYMIVTVRAGSNVSDPAAVVRQAILDYAGGLLDGETGFTVGADVSAFELAAAINSEAIDIFVTNFLIGDAPAPTTSDTVTITIAQRATIIPGNISVVIV